MKNIYSCCHIYNVSIMAYFIYILIVIKKESKPATIINIISPTLKVHDKYKISEFIEITNGELDEVIDTNKLGKVKKKYII